MTAAPPRHGGPAYGGSAHGGPPSGGDSGFFWSEDDEPQPRPRRRRTGRWVLAGFALAVIAALLIAGAYLFALQRAYSENVTHFPGRDDPAAQEVLPPEEERPAATEATNILLLGTDEGGGSGEDEDLPRVPGGGRSDTMMLVHIPEDRDSVQVISIPRDLWVEIPGGYGWHKVNAGLALGGEQGHWLAVATVEQLLDARIDHVAAVDLLGFTGLVEDMGGVTVNSDVAFTAVDGTNFTEGEQHLDPEEALAFVRERQAFGEGDLQRIRNQQAFIQGVASDAASPGNLANPVQAHSMVETLASHLMTDPDLTATTAASLLWEGRGAANTMQFTTLPDAGWGYSDDGQWIFYQDEAAQQEISRHMREGTLEEHLSD